MIMRDCSSLVELISFIEKENGNSARSGWWKDRYFRMRTTEAEKLEMRRYMKGNVFPLMYTQPCEAPHLVKTPTAKITVKELEFPTIKAEANINCKDVAEHRVSNTGEYVPQRERYREAVNWGMMPLIEGLRLRGVCDAISILTTGKYDLVTGKMGALASLGTVDFCREDELNDIDLTGTEAAWTNLCSKPLKAIEAILRAMSRCKGAVGQIDIIYSPLAWQWMEAHSEREAIKYRESPVIPTGFSADLYSDYDDVTFRGQTRHGGLTLNHFENYATKVTDVADPLTGEPVEEEILAPGEIMIISPQAFGGQHVFRTVTEDLREYLPRNTNVPYFMYDDPMDPEVYSKKCRAYKPWLEAHPLMVPANPNAAVKVRVVPEDAGDPCVNCEVCPGDAPAAP